MSSSKDCLSSSSNLLSLSSNADNRDNCQVVNIAPLVSREGSIRCERNVSGRDEVLIIENQKHSTEQLSVLAFLLETFRRSLVICTATGRDDSFGSSMEISWPTNVRHVVHVTFDKFHGFLGLPVEFELEVPVRVPSASVSVFGVSAESMQCSFDSRGNSVPTILLLMQHKLYSVGGLKVEGIFRINAENSHEENVRSQLNKGIVPHDIDPHCLAGLIKAWFRELPKGVLDSLTPEQVIQCNTEEDCLELIKILPPTQAALLDWATNLMADVVQEEHYNKMNCRSVAMVFAPNMTQMADPLTALMYAVQVMNFLKMLILRTLREREEAASGSVHFTTHEDYPAENKHASTSFIENEHGYYVDEDENTCGCLQSLFDAYSNNIEESPNGDCFSNSNKKDTMDEDGCFSVIKKVNFSPSDHSNGDFDACQANLPESYQSVDIGNVRGSITKADLINNNTSSITSFSRKSVEVIKKSEEHFSQSMVERVQKLKEKIVLNNRVKEIESTKVWQ